MATDERFATYVCDQLARAGAMTVRRMFGEYALYCDGKVVALLCDNRFFLKITAAPDTLLPSRVEGFPYPGAKPWIVLDEHLDDVDLMTRLVRATADALPPPRPKRRRRPAKAGVKRSTGA